jgi:two-component system, NarL family, invasion response regulator UvrY
MQKNLHILIADDHKLVRMALKAIITEAYPQATITEVSSGVELIKQSTKSNWDLIMIDISFPDQSGLEIIKQLKANHVKYPILVVSMYPAAQYAIRCLTAGAVGYLSKDQIANDLIIAINKILQGKRYITQDVAEILAANYESEIKAVSHNNLTDREYQIFKLIVEGVSMQHISSKLSISVNTVRTHKVNILKKMNLQTDAEIISYAITHSLA